MAKHFAVFVPVFQPHFSGSHHNNHIADLFLCQCQHLEDCLYPGEHDHLAISSFKLGSSVRFKIFLGEFSIFS